MAQLTAQRNNFALNLATSRNIFGVFAKSVELAPYVNRSNRIIITWNGEHANA